VSEFFADLRAIAAWTLRVAAPGDFAPIGEHFEAAWLAERQAGSLGERPGRFAPSSAAVTAAAVTPAMAVLDGDDDSAVAVLRTLLRRYPSGYHGLSRVRPVFRAWDDVSPRLRRLVWRARDPDVTYLDRLRFRTCTGSPQEPAEDYCRRRARHVPQMLWPGWTMRLLPPSGFHTDTFRAVMAAALLMPGNPRRSWSEPLQLLGRVDGELSFS
jgi:hypothetical protein